MSGTAWRGTIGLVLLVSGCRGEGAPPDLAETPFATRDSAGITIVENGVLMPTNALASPEADLSIGVVDGPAEYQLFGVSSVRRLSDGSIVVANGGSADVRIYGPDGAHRATAGGRGDGPSEFRYPSALVILDGDTIQVQDGLDRVLFTSDGDFVRRLTGRRGALVRVTEPFGDPPEMTRWAADQSLVAMVIDWDDRPLSGLYRPKLTLVRLSEDLSSASILGIYGGALQQLIDVGGPGPGGTMSFPPPFYPNTSWAASRADGTAVVGDTERSQLDLHHADGTRSIVRWSASREAVTPEAVEDWKREQREGQFYPQYRAQLERGWAEMDLVDHKPYFDGFTVGSDGTAWVHRLSDGSDSTRLVGFGPEGRYRGSVELPGSFNVHDSGPDWLLGVHRGEQDVEFVQLYRLAAAK